MRRFLIVAIPVTSFAHLMLLDCSSSTENVAISGTKELSDILIPLTLELTINVYLSAHSNLTNRANYLICHLTSCFVFSAVPFFFLATTYAT